MESLLGKCVEGSWDSVCLEVYILSKLFAKSSDVSLIENDDSVCAMVFVGVGSGVIKMWVVVMPTLSDVALSLGTGKLEEKSIVVVGILGNTFEEEEGKTAEMIGFGEGRVRICVEVLLLEMVVLTIVFVEEVLVAI